VPSFEKHCCLNYIELQRLMWLQQQDNGDDAEYQLHMNKTFISRTDVRGFHRDVTRRIVQSWRKGVADARNSYFPPHTKTALPEGKPFVSHIETCSQFIRHKVKLVSNAK
jgi:hypothetical protein